jgi:ABC-2 type transport system ATP-binding protein
VFSAHNLYHVESVCDRIVIMNRGEIIARGTVPEIRESYGETTYHVFTTVPVEDSEPVAGAEPERHRTVVPDMDAVEELRERAAAAGGSVADIRTREQSLEDIFLELARGTPETDTDRGREPVAEGDPGADPAREHADRPEATTPGPEEPGTRGGDRR